MTPEEEMELTELRRAALQLTDSYPSLPRRSITRLALWINRFSAEEIACLERRPLLTISRFLNKARGRLGRDIVPRRKPWPCMARDAQICREAVCQTPRQLAETYGLSSTSIYAILKRGPAMKRRREREPEPEDHLRISGDSLRAADAFIVGRHAPPRHLTF
jgi:hypothetical protein